MALELQTRTVQEKYCLGTILFFWQDVGQRVLAICIYFTEEQSDLSCHLDYTYKHSINWKKLGPNQGLHKVVYKCHPPPTSFTLATEGNMLKLKINKRHQLWNQAELPQSLSSVSVWPLVNFLTIQGFIFLTS